MSEAAKAEIIALLRRFRRNPTDIASSGLVKINTPQRWDEEKGEFVQAEEDSEDGEQYGKYIVPMRYTETQNLLDVYCDYCRKQGKSVAIDILKARREGVSTYIQARAVAKANVIDGYKVITVAHKPNSAESLYAIGREMLRNFPEWLGVSKRLQRDSKEYLEIKNHVFGVTNSSLKTVSENNIDSVHGQGYAFQHNSECARYENKDRFEEATSSLLMKSPMSEIWNESTAHGDDAYFAPIFKAAWERQGEVNFWEPGYRWFRAPSCAVFIPWWRNQTTKTIELHPELTYEGYLAALDDEEKHLLHKYLMPLWTTYRKYAESEALRRSLRQLYWRRCKLSPFYRDDIPLVNPGSKSYHSRTAFMRMEPATIEEAFVSESKDDVFSPNDQEYLKSTVQTPIKRAGFRSDFTMEFGSSVTVDEIRLYASFWKMPDETSGDIGCSVDFARGQAFIPSGKIEWGSDFTHALFFDNSNGEMVAEYVSQEMNHIAANQIWTMIMFYKNRDKYPSLIWETAYATTLQSLVIKNDYDLDRVFFRKAEDSLRFDMNRMGFYPSPSAKVARVQAGVKDVSSKRIVNRSSHIAKQAGFFVEKMHGSTIQYEASHKGKSSRNSIDDGIVAMCQYCYMQENHIHETSVSVLEEQFDQNLETFDHTRSPMSQLDAYEKLVARGINPYENDRSSIPEGMLIDPNLIFGENE